MLWILKTKTCCGYTQKHPKSMFKLILQYDKYDFSIYCPLNSTLSLSGEVGDWKNHFTVAENEQFDKLLEKNKSSLKFVYSI